MSEEEEEEEEELMIGMRLKRDEGKGNGRCREGGLG